MVRRGRFSSSLCLDEGEQALSGSIGDRDPPLAAHRGIFVFQDFAEGSKGFSARPRGLDFNSLGFGVGLAISDMEKVSAAWCAPLLPAGALELSVTNANETHAGDPI
jgi:hypothetical protein